MMMMMTTTMMMMMMMVMMKKKMMKMMMIMMMMMMKMMMKMKAPAVCVFVTLGVLAPVRGGEHSLYYTYTALSQPLQLPGIYDFIALGMLDDRELDYYNSQTQIKVPKQHWMREKMPPDYWEKGTQSRKSKEQWFKVNVDILMDRMRHNKTDLHVLQWRHGCVIDEDKEGNVKFLRGFDEYSYDGSEFLSFDDVNSRWIAPVPAAEPTKRKWDEVQILTQYTKGYLEKECVDWLTKFMDYGVEELKKFSVPKVNLLTKNSVMDRGRATLTCLVTGFYPPDVHVLVRKSRTSIPEHLVTSSGVRPNGDGTYQLRKSVEIKKEEEPLYDCYVTHITFKEPIVIRGKNCKDCSAISISIICALIVFGTLLAGIAGVSFILYKKGRIGRNGEPARNENVAYIQAPTAGGYENGHINGNVNEHMNGHATGSVEQHEDQDLRQ